MVLFTVVHLHLKNLARLCSRQLRAISVIVLARICLASTLDYTVMQLRKLNKDYDCYCALNRSEQNVRNWPSWVDTNCLSDFLYSNMDFSKQLFEEK